MAYPPRSPVPSHKNVRGRFGGFLLFPDLARSKSSKRNGKLSKENPANWPGEQIVPTAKAQNFRNLSLVSVNSSLAFWTKKEFWPTSTPCSYAGGVYMDCELCIVRNCMKMAAQYKL